MTMCLLILLGLLLYRSIKTPKRLPKRLNRLGVLMNTLVKQPDFLGLLGRRLVKQPKTLYKKPNQAPFFGKKRKGHILIYTEYGLK